MKLTSILSTALIFAGAVGTFNPATLAQSPQQPARPTPPPPNNINPQPPQEPPKNIPPEVLQEPPVLTPPDESNTQAPVEQEQGPQVGIEMITLTSDIAKKINSGDFDAGFQVPDKEGVLIARVRVNTPAMAAGLREGDVIVELEGQAITQAEQVKQIVTNSRIGQSLSFKIQRGNQTNTVTVRLEEPSSSRVDERPALEELPRLEPNR
jgi:membrane-associated protease RseP (regulator of RpoE activity)